MKRSLNLRRAIACLSLTLAFVVVSQPAHPLWHWMLLGACVAGTVGSIMGFE